MPKRASVAVPRTSSSWFQCSSFPDNNNDISCTITRVFPTTHFCDWIKDAQMLFRDETTMFDEITLIFAHNFAQFWKFEGGELIYQYTIQCEERCIIYAARFHGSSRNSLQLAVGTVFNQVHLWDIFTRNEKGDAPVLKRFEGHEGVIFTVAFSEDGRQVLSTSDDRSVKVWSIDDQFHPRTLFGHVARVWSGLFSSSNVISVSEDGSCHIWNPVSEELAASWQCSVHDAWCVAINPSGSILATGGEDGSIRLWSVSEVLQQNFGHQEVVVELKNVPARLSIFDVINKTSYLCGTDDGSILHVELLDDDQKQNLFYHNPSYAGYCKLVLSDDKKLVLLGKDDGRILAINASKKSAGCEVEWIGHRAKVVHIKAKFVSASDDVRLYDVFVVTCFDAKCSIAWFRLEICDTINVNFMATFEAGDNDNICYENIKAFDLVYVNKTALFAYSSSNNALNVSMIQQDDINQLKYEAIDTKEGSRTIFLASTKVDVKSPQKKLTISNLFIFNDRIYLTSREGYLLVYQINLSNPDLPKIELDNFVKVTKGWTEKVDIFNGDIYVSGFFQKKFFVYNQTRRLELMSVACGGGYRPWSFSFHNSRAYFRYIREKKLHIVSKPVKCDAEVCGFSESKLVGGGCALSGDTFHGKETRFVKYFRPHGDLNEFIITGGEDCLMKIWKGEECESDQKIVPCGWIPLHEVLTLKKHVSVVCDYQIVQIVGSNHESSLSSWFLFSCGGKEEIRCWKMDIDENTIQTCVEYATCPQICDIPDTRIMAIDVIPFTSFLESTNTAFFEDLYLISAAYSDGFLRYWIFSKSLRHFYIISKTPELESCYLTIRTILSPISTQSQQQFSLTSGHSVSFTHTIHCFSSDTKGRLFHDVLNNLLHAYILTLPVSPSGLLATNQDIVTYHRHHWSSTDLRRRQMRHAHTSNSNNLSRRSWKVHQNGVTHFDIVFIEAWKEWVVCTGGDDQCVSLSIFSKSFDLVSTYDLVGHASTVRGIKLQSTSNGLFLFTVALDQRVFMWRISGAPISVSLVTSCVTDIADVSGLDVTKSRGRVRLVISGTGIQQFSIPLPPPHPSNQ